MDESQKSIQSRPRGRLAYAAKVVLFVIGGCLAGLLAGGAIALVLALFGVTIPNQ